MNELTGTDHTAYSAIDDALNSYPLDSPPASILPAVMARIETYKPAQSKPIPRFQLAWIDYALSLFVAGMAELIFLLWPSSPQPLDWTTRLQFQLMILWQQLRFNSPLFIAAMLGAILLSAMALLVAWSVFAREGYQRRRLRIEHT